MLLSNNPFKHIQTTIWFCLINNDRPKHFLVFVYLGCNWTFRNTKSNWSNYFRTIIAIEYIFKGVQKHFLPVLYNNLQDLWGLTVISQPVIPPSIHLSCWLDLDQYRRTSQKSSTVRQQRSRLIATKYLNRNYFFGTDSPATTQQQTDVRHKIYPHCALRDQPIMHILKY